MQRGETSFRASNGSYDGASLQDPERFRLRLADELAERIDTMTRALDEGEPAPVTAERYRELSLLMFQLEELFAGSAPQPYRLQRFCSEAELADLSRGSRVVFMGYDRDFHRVGLDLLAESFREEKLVLGREYTVLEMPDMERGKSFAIRGPHGRKVYFDYTYFGREIGAGGSDAHFVTDWGVW